MALNCCHRFLQNIDSFVKKTYMKTIERQNEAVSCFIEIPHIPCAVLLSAAFLMQKSTRMIESVECLAEVIKQTVLLVP